MKNILPVVLLFLICYIVEKTTNVKPTTDFKDKFEYIPIITANIYADLFIIFVTFSRIYYKKLTFRFLYFTRSFSRLSIDFAGYRLFFEDLSLFVLSYEF
jgi:hypothetical protein